MPEETPETVTPAPETVTQDAAPPMQAATQHTHSYQTTWEPDNSPMRKCLCGALEPPTMP